MTTPAVRRLAHIAVLAVLLVVGQACGQGPSPAGPEVRVDGGEIPSGSWTAWAFQSADSGTCMQIRLEAGDVSSLCGVDGDHTWMSDLHNGTFVGGVVKDERPVRARLTLADGTTLEAPIVREASLSRLGFFVLPPPAGLEARGLDLLALDGSVVSSRPLE